MNVTYYEEILEDFKRYHPYMANGIDDWRPNGNAGIRVTMKDGKVYDFHSMSKTIRNVDNRPVYDSESFNEDEWRKVFADRLCEYMCTTGITQQSLSEYTGLSKGSINKYVNGKATPSGYALTKLAKAFGCSVMDLTY